MSSNEPISIAIIGAGIAGITLALALAKRNPSLQITIYESRPEFSEIGAGVGFGPNSTLALSLISPEVADAYDKVSTVNFSHEKRFVWFDMRHGTGPKAGELIYEIATGDDFVHGGASRAHFLDNLVALIPKSVKTEFNKKAVDVWKDEVTGKTKVKFNDGGEIEADAVVGCDGIRSACRKILLGPDHEAANAVYSGKYAYRVVVEMEKAVAAGGKQIRNRTIFTGHGGHILMFPIRNGKFLNIVAFVDAKGVPWTDHRWVIPSSREEVLEDYKGWGRSATSILELINEPDKWALFNHLPAPTFTKDNFCILGDAAHASTPHSGAGAGFAVEDSYLLSGLFSPDVVKSASDIKYAFKAYDEIRRPRDQSLVTRSRRQGMRLDLQKDDGSLLEVEELKTSIADNMKWVWEVDLVGTLKEAKLLVERYKASNGT